MTDTMDEWYTAADTPELVEFATVRGLGVSGVGAPGAAEHTAAVGGMYAVAGPLTGRAGLAMPVLEGRWWTEDDRPALEVPRERWRWHLFMRLPETVPDAWVDEARQGSAVPAAARVLAVSFTVGRCLQVMHHGAFADEPATLARLDAVMSEHGLVMNGLHHEIYLSDLRHTPEHDLRTILRHPVRPG